VTREQAEQLLSANVGLRLQKIWATKVRWEAKIGFTLMCMDTLQEHPLFFDGSLNQETQQQP
jgi:hypothetical protein